MKNLSPEKQKELFQKIKDKRALGKTVNYGAVYGAGAPTMSRSSGMPVTQCKTLLEAYWKKNWSVKEIEKACITKELNGQMWQYNPVSKFWYSLRYMKDRFSTLNQGTGVFCFDKWVANARRKGIRMCGQFHDEVVFPLVNETSILASNRQVLHRSVQEVNDQLKLNRPLGIDVQFGNSYAEIH